MLDGQFGHFIIKDALGTGGMATVYRAYDKKRREHIALKVLHEQFVDGGIISIRFAREAQIASNLEHPHIVPVLESGVVKKRHYLVMPLYSGGTLASYFYSPRKLTYQRILGILTPLASALDYAHSQSVVHRDFKLQNILLNDKNEPAISDFGIARLNNSTQLTGTGQMLGTANYMAPEMVTGNIPVDHRADIYSFGVLAFLLLTGRFPYIGVNPFEVALLHQAGNPPLPSSINTYLSQPTNEVLLKSLALEPDERYQSAGDFVMALGKALSGAEALTTLILLKPEQGLIPADNFYSADVIVAPDIQPVARKKLRRPLLLLFSMLVIVVSLYLAYILSDDTAPVIADNFSGVFVDNESDDTPVVTAEETAVLSQTDSHPHTSEDVNSLATSTIIASTPTPSPEPVEPTATPDMPLPVDRGEIEPTASATPSPVPTSTDTGIPQPTPLPSSTMIPIPTDIPPTADTGNNDPGNDTPGNGGGNGGNGSGGNDSSGGGGNRNNN